MRLILARILWSFDMQLAPEYRDWDNQENWIQWDKEISAGQVAPA